MALLKNNKGGAHLAKNASGAANAAHRPPLDAFDAQNAQQMAQNAPAARGARPAGSAGISSVQVGGNATGAAKPAKKAGRRLIKVLGIIGGVVLLLAVAAFIYVKWGVSTPDRKESMRNNRTSSGDYDPDDPDRPGAGNGGNKFLSRNPEKRPNNGKFTFLLLGTDDGSNTDVIMAATFDSYRHTLEVVNIPRDTRVNVSWGVKKANSIYTYMKIRHRGEDKAQEKAMEDTIVMFADLLGFEVDYMAIVDLKAFAKLVDSVGGVDFDVPRNMSYDDPAQNLHIHFSAGLQHLNGQQALEVVRYRAGYADADIGRIRTQQGFLESAAKQILEKKNSLNLIEIAGIFFDYVKTDMSLNDIIWFAKEFMKIDAENVNFTTAPGNYFDSVNGQSYVTLYVDAWLELVNTKLSPWNTKITQEDVSFYYRGTDGGLYITDEGNGAEPRSSPGAYNPPANSSGGNPSPAGNSQPPPAAQPSTTGAPASTATPGASDSPGQQNAGEPEQSPATAQPADGDGDADGDADDEEPPGGEIEGDGDGDNEGEGEPVEVEPEEPQETDPAETQPSEPEPGETQPAQTDTGATDPGESDPAEPEHE
ncbi:MAG: LCP family protein [Oscillospiraceae bacterium]|nr:LCP family protein [Oscillospiraceae bacterium]